MLVANGCRCEPGGRGFKSCHSVRHRTDPSRLGAHAGCRRDGAMRTTRWLMATILGLALVACVDMQTTPAPEARLALAPTGKLRVGLQLGSPHNAVRDAVSGEMKGVGFDLGTELARRLGVPMEPVMYPSVGALLDGGKSGAWDVAFVGFSPARANEWDFTALHMQME